MPLDVTNNCNLDGKRCEKSTIAIVVAHTRITVMIGEALLTGVTGRVVCCDERSGVDDCVREPWELVFEGLQIRTEIGEAWESGMIQNHGNKYGVIRFKVAENGGDEIVIGDRFANEDESICKGFRLIEVLINGFRALGHVKKLEVKARYTGDRTLSIMILQALLDGFCKIVANS